MKSLSLLLALCILVVGVALIIPLARSARALMRGIYRQSDGESHRELPTLDPEPEPCSAPIAFDARTLHEVRAQECGEKRCTPAPAWLDIPQ